MRRLLGLDDVLEYPRIALADPKPTGVAAFAALGIEWERRPQRVYRGAFGGFGALFPLETSHRADRHGRTTAPMQIRMIGRPLKRAGTYSGRVLYAPHST